MKVKKITPFLKVKSMKIVIKEIKDIKENAQYVMKN